MYDEYAMEEFASIIGRSIVSSRNRNVNYINRDETFGRCKTMRDKEFITAV